MMGFKHEIYPERSFLAIFLFLSLSFLFLSVLFLPVFTSGIPHNTLRHQNSQKSKEPQEWWEIKIILTSRGKYEVKEGKVSFTGHYSFEIPWTGCMERDEEDFIIYHESWELRKWEAKETANSAGSVRSILAKDISDKPRFVFRYILQHNDNLHFDFYVGGFPLPLNESERKYALQFPASEEGAKGMEANDYNLYITEGSNRVFLDKKEISREPVTKTFQWNWSSQKWLSQQKSSVFLSQSHEVKAKILILPHYE